MAKAKEFFVFYIIAKTNAVARMLPTAVTIRRFCVSAKTMATIAPVIEAIVLEVAKNIAGKIIAPKTEYGM